MAELGALAERFRRTPLDRDGRATPTARPTRSGWTAPRSRQLIDDAGYTYPIYRDVFAAARALDAGDPAPMLRLAAEDLHVRRGRPRRVVLGGRLRRRRVP